MPIFIYIENIFKKYGHENEMYNVGLSLKEGEGL